MPLVIRGSKFLKGEIIPQGSKNESLQIISAVLLTKQPVVINNVPDILDVNRLIDVLKHIGVRVNKRADKSFEFQADNINLEYLKSPVCKKLTSQIRGSVMILGPLLAVYKKSYISKPGGDKIGRRRLDTHINGFLELGAKFSLNKDNILELSTEKLKGTYITLEEASVTGTANIIMASVLADGRTVIYNAACEPYIQQLCKMINRMGGKISGIASNRLIIEGVERLSGATHTILPDMIEVGSWIGLAAMTKSELTIKNVSFENLGIIPNVFRKLGIQLIRKGDNIFIPKHTKGYEIQNFLDESIMTISDAPWPGFTPDLLSIVLVVATQAKGSVLIHQKMFESRLFFVDKLIDMGAKVILCDPHRATVIGLNFKSLLKATVMVTPDIRSGVSLLIAALSAKGKSIIYNEEQIDRGYENIVQRLKNVGADIERVNSL